MEPNIVVINHGVDPKPLKFNYFKNARTKSEIKINTQSDVVVLGKNMIADTPPMSYILDTMIVDVNNNVAKKVFNIYDAKLEEVNWLEKKDFTTLNNKFSEISGCSGTFEQDEFGQVYNFSYIDNESKIRKEFLENYKKNFGLNTFFVKEPVGIGALWITHLKDYCSPDNIIYDIMNIYYFKNKTMSNIEIEITTKFLCNKYQTEKNEKNNILKFSGSAHTINTIDLNTAEREIKSISFSNISNNKDTGLIDIFDRVEVSSTFVC